MCYFCHIYFISPYTFKDTYPFCWASLVAQLVKKSPAMQETPHQRVGKIPWRRDRRPTPVSLGDIFSILADICNFDKLCKLWASPVTQMVKNLPAMHETWVGSLGWEDPLEQEMATPRHRQRSLAGYSPWGHKESDTAHTIPFLLLICTVGKFLVIVSPSFFPLLLEGEALYISLISLCNTLLQP